jgi:hypothetical protein
MPAGPHATPAPRAVNAAALQGPSVMRTTGLTSTLRAEPVEGDGSGFGDGFVVEQPTVMATTAMVAISATTATT